MFSLKLVDGAAAWVTGGSRGIGRATCLALAKAGADVAVGYKSQAAAAEAVVAEIKALGRKAVAVQVDVADAAACERAFKDVTAALGRVDVLVNNAAVVADNLFPMLEAEDWAKVLDTNLMGVVHATKTVIRDMMGRRHGRIINVSSAAGTKGGRGQSNYAASKGAVEAMSRSLAVELAKRNITVNCVAPGVIETDMSAEVRKLAEKEIMDRQLIKRYGQPEEVAALIVYLASEQAGFVTGQTFAIDGGLKMP
jgi:3-oxoacyl-[acyl-carrier protein] reductase